MPRGTARLLHPRTDPASPDGRHLPSGLAAAVLAFVRAHGATHPQDLEARFGRERAMNNWGGFSKATTRILHSLQHHGLLRVVRRRDGIRVYEAAEPHPAPLAPSDRVRALVLLLARILAPVPATSLRAAFGLMARRTPGLGRVGHALEDLLKSGELACGDLDDERYIWPADSNAAAAHDAPREVRFLAPFDPVVWDRRRFEHLWGWPYRLEAYTPPPKRRFGYYAMPLLWGDRVIGWVNAGTPNGRLEVEAGFVAARPAARSMPRSPGSKSSSDHLSPCGRGRREAAGEGVSPNTELVERTLTPTLSRNGRGGPASLGREGLRAPSR